MLRHVPRDFRWWESVSIALPAGDVWFAADIPAPWTTRKDPQGEYLILARLDDASWLRFEWAYGSCDVCDGWAGLGAGKIHEEIQEDSEIMSAEELADFVIAGLAIKEPWTRQVNPQGSSLSLESLLKKVASDVPRKAYTSIRDWGG